MRIDTNTPSFLEAACAETVAKAKVEAPAAAKKLVAKAQARHTKATKAAAKAKAPKATKATKGIKAKATAPKAPKAPRTTTSKKPSGLDLCVKALANGPLNAKEVCAKVLALGWATQGKTPAATLYAAMFREVKAGEGSRFALDGGAFSLTNVSKAS